MAEIVAMPKLGFDMAEGTLVHWVVAEGSSIDKGQVLAEIETDKATVEVESSAAGIVYRHLVEEGAVVPVGTPIAVIAAPGEEVKDIPEPDKAQEIQIPSQKQATEEVPAAGATSEPVLPAEPSTIKASPLARRMAAELNLNLGSIAGTGPGGRITKRDVEKAASSTPVSIPGEAVIPASAAKASLPLPVWTLDQAPPEDRRIPLDKLRLIIGKRMSESKQQVPHFYITHEVNAGPLMELRKSLNEHLADDQKLSVNDFIIKAVGLSLRQFPALNASLNGNEIIQHGRVNVGVAVALENGLITIVSKDADQKPLRRISAEIREMVGRARQGKVKTEDIEGSTFSISNLGMYDVEHFVAIINPPEAAILAVGSVKEVPVVENGEVKPGLRVKLTISADHRVTDGAEAAKFMQVLAGFLEKPLQLVL